MAETLDKAGEADLELEEKKLVVNSVAAALEKKPGPKLGVEPTAAELAATVAAVAPAAVGGSPAVLGA